MNYLPEINSFYSFFFLSLLVIFSLASGASIDRYESEKPAQTTVIHLLRTSEVLNDRRPTNDSKHQEDDRQEDEEEYYYDDDEQDEYELSGDFEMPQGNSEVLLWIFYVVFFV